MNCTERENILNSYKKFIRLKSIYYIISMSVICCVNSFATKGILSFLFTCFGILFVAGIAEKYKQQYADTVDSINSFIDENPQLKKEIVQHKAKYTVLMILLVIVIFGFLCYLLLKGFPFIPYFYIPFAIILTFSALLLHEYMEIKILKKYLL